MALWRVDEAAEYLGIRPKTLYEWVRTGRVPHRKLGFNVRFDPSELEGWVREQAPALHETSAGRGSRSEAVLELCNASAEAVRQLRRLDTDVGTQLSFPQRQAIKTLAKRLERAVGEAREG